MISFAIPLSAGNAVQLAIQPPAGVAQVRLLRKTSNTWIPDGDPAAADDPDAFVVADESSPSWSQLNVMDTRDLDNGTAYFYKAWYRKGSVWSSSASMSVTPLSTFQVAGVDVLTLLRDRIHDGLASMVARGLLSPKDGYIPVLLSPPVADDTPFPVVSLHLDSEVSGERVVGDDLGDEFDGAMWEEAEGWLARIKVDIGVYALNGDERSQVRRALRGVIQANMRVLDAAGCIQVDLQLQHTEDMETYSAPVFVVVGSVTCLAPAYVTSSVQPIRDISIQVF